MARPKSHWSFSQSSSDFWGDRLVIRVSKHAIHVEVAKALLEQVLSSPGYGLSDVQRSVVEWVARRAAGFRKVHLNSSGDRGYRTVSLLLALYNSGRSNSFKPELELHTGKCTTYQACL